MTPAEEKLAGLLLELAQMYIPRMAAARKIVRALDAGLPLMNMQQQEVARARMEALQNRWGRLLPGMSEINCTGADPWEIAPEKMIALWLSRRKNPERLLRVVRKAAQSIWGGEYRMSRVMEYAYGGEIDRVVHPVGYDSFKEWLIELRVGVAKKDGRKTVWMPGPLTGRLVNTQDNLYEASLTELVQLKTGRR